MLTIREIIEKLELVSGALMIEQATTKNKLIEACYLKAIYKLDLLMMLRVKELFNA